MKQSVESCVKALLRLLGSFDHPHHHLHCTQSFFFFSEPRMMLGPDEIIAFLDASERGTCSLSVVDFFPSKVQGMSLKSFSRVHGVRALNSGNGSG